MRSVHMTQGRGVGSNTKEADGCPVAGRTCRRLLRRSGSRKMAWGRYVLRQSWAAMMGGGHLLNPLASVHDVRISQTTVCLGSTHTFTLWRNFSQDKYPKFNYFKGCSVIENIILYGAQESLAILRSKCTIKLQWHVGILTPRGVCFWASTRRQGQLQKKSSGLPKQTVLRTVTTRHNGAFGRAVSTTPRAVTIITMPRHGACRGDALVDLQGRG